MSVVSVTEAELYQIIGELYVARAKTDQLAKQQMAQVEEMSKVITDLRERLSGKLGESAPNNTV